MHPKRSGVRLDKMISERYEDEPELKGFRYKKTELFLGNPESSDEYFASQTNNHGLIKLDLKVTAKNMLEISEVFLE